MGTNVIVVLPGATTVGGVRGGQGTAVTLTVSDGLELKKRIPLLVDTGWARRDVMQIVNGNRNWNGPVNGISPGYLTIRDWAYTSGGPFTQVDVDSAARVALIGQTTVENLFDAGEEPVATIRIKNVPFRIVGVLTPKGQSAQGSDQDDVLFIPFTTAERKVFGRPVSVPVGALFGVYRTPRGSAGGGGSDTGGPADPPSSSTRASLTILRSARESISGVSRKGTSHTLTVMLFAIASVSLLVGGIGIMNILLVSVTERTREIGIRMAVGAKRFHILMQFLIEAVTLSVTGGLIGIGIGIIGAWLTTIVAGWPTIISADSIVTAFIFSAGVGLFFRVVSCQ